MLAYKAGSFLLCTSSMIVKGTLGIYSEVHVLAKLNYHLSCRHVVNYDFPNHIEDYVHRVGRTGRAG